MSNPSAHIPIPLHRQLVAKEAAAIPTHTYSLDHMKGTSNGQQLSSPNRWNCCWIETAFHAIGSDIYLQHFIRYLKPDGLNTTWRGQVPDSLQRSYDRGLQVCKMLQWRLKHCSYVDQAHWDTEHENVILKNVREIYSTSSDAANMGDMDELIRHMLSDMMVYVHYEWNSSHFQKLYLTYGHRIIQRREAKCTNIDCTWREVVYHHPWGNDAATIGDLNGVGEDCMMKGIVPSPVNSSLEEMLNRSLNQMWAPMPGHCPGCFKKHTRLVRSRLVSLPFMLYVPIKRKIMIRVIYNKHRLEYNPDKLIIGPIGDPCHGTSATYELVSRILYGGAHYTIDMRLDNGTFRNWNFHKISDSSHMTHDDNSSFMVWRRVR